MSQSGTSPRCPLEDLWLDILGEAAGPCDAVCGGCHDPALARMPAATLADQSKAFERLSVAWLVKVLHGWQMPLWVICAFLCLIYSKEVRAIIRGKPGLLRLLECKLGMGGPASPFLWNLAYDPLVGVALTLRIEYPT